MKKSIALFITLLFSIVLFGIISYFFKLYNNISNSFEKDLSQNSLLIMDIKSIIDNLSKDLNKSTIKKIYSFYPINSKDGNFRVLVEVKPLADKINLNDFSDKKKFPYINNFLDNLLEFFSIKDPVFFKDLLLDTLDKDLIEREADSEIKLNNPFFQNGKIYNYSHFKKILDYYVKKRNDFNIYKIPWQNLVYFSSVDSIIDCNLLDKNMAKFLGLKFDKEVSCKELKKFKENEKILKNLNIIPFNKKNTYLIEIKINYKKNKMSFIYNISQKRIENIKSNFLY